MNYKYPTYNKGEVIVWSIKDLDYDVAKLLAEEVGCEITGEPFDKCFLLKTEVGKELESGQDLIDNYPEFFQSCEREDIRFKDIDLKVDTIKEHADDIVDMITWTDNRKFVKPNEFNANIDSIIDELNKLKIKD